MDELPQLPRGRGQGINLPANVEIIMDKVNTSKIQCPVVTQYNRRRKRGPELGYTIPKPGNHLGIAYNSMIQMAELEKLWILSAVEKTGSMVQASKLLGISRETVYRKVREYARETK